MSCRSYFKLWPTPPALYSTPSDISPMVSLSGMYCISESGNYPHWEFGLSSVRCAILIDFASLCAAVGVDSEDGLVKVLY